MKERGTEAWRRLKQRRREGRAAVALVRRHPETGELFCFQARDLGLSLGFHNGGRHWIFRGDCRFFVEWWPCGGRLVFERRYDEAEFVADFDEVLKRIVDIRLRRGGI